MVVTTVHPECHRRLAGVQANSATIQPADDSQIGLAVIGDIDHIDGFARVDLRRFAIVDLVRQQRTDHTGAHPQCVFPFGRDIQRVARDTVGPIREVTDPGTFGQLLFLHCVTVPVVGLNFPAGSCFSLNPDIVLCGNDIGRGKRKGQQKQAGQ